MKRAQRLSWLLAGTLILALTHVHAAQGGYRLPPPAVARAIDAPPPPSIRFAPDAGHALEVHRDALPDLVDVMRPMERLAGMRIDAAARARHSTQYDRALWLRDLRGSERTQVPLPEDARLSSVSWSHDSVHFAYVLHSEAGSSLWLASIEDAAAPTLVTDALCAILWRGFGWTSQGDGLWYTRAIPMAESASDAGLPMGPITSESAGELSPLRTYQDLLDTPEEAALFEALTSAELLRHDPGAEPQSYGVAMWSSVDAAPDGEHVLLHSIERPFSYLMPASRFPQRIEVRDASAELVRLVAEVPLGEGIPIDGVRTGPRSHGWRPSQPATLYWCEALDGGDPKREAVARDRWLQQAAPFEGEPRELMRTVERARGVSFTADGQYAVAGEYDRDLRWTRALLHDLTDADAEPRVLEDRSIRDRYGDPGRLLTESDARGSRVIVRDGDFVYRAGEGSSDDGARPFLDRQDLTDLSTQRLWRCSPGSYESVVALEERAPGRWPRFITRYESPAEPANYRLRDQEAQAGSIDSLTSFLDPTPELRGVRKQLVTYERADGVPLSATLYLPADWQPGTRLPLFVWAYPREFNDPSTAGQVSGSPYRFTRFSGSSHLFLVTQGWAVMDAATMPVIGDPETMNDTFIEQIVMAAEAAIDTASELGVADRERVAVGGHSYGAFMTANLLAHSDLFKAGVARSGAYNRTLTPFGFQAERRTLWEAVDTYVSVSPFLHADGIEAPLLLVHGQMDNNSGTFPMQSERLFQAIKGNGGTSRLVMLPGESHGYRARESVMHVQAETIDWLQRHVAGPSVD